MELPLRRPLAAQVALYLREQIAAGEWREALPSERALAARCRVSRTVIRAALEVLRKEKLLVGGRLRPLSAAWRKVTSRRVVHLLNSVPLEEAASGNVLELDHLRETLYADGYRVEWLSSRRVDWSHPGAYLERLARQTRSDCWVLSSPSHAVQRWFQKRGLPAILSGTPYPGIRFPFVDADWPSVARHLAGVISTSGHRRVAVLCHQEERAGDHLFHQTLAETLARQAPEVALKLCRHPADAAGALRAVRRLVRGAGGPTLVVASNVENAMSAFSVLLQEGLAIPRDISLLLRHATPLFERLHPAPTGYWFDPGQAAKALAGAVRTLVECGPGAVASTHLEAEFRKGETVRRLRVV